MDTIMLLELAALLALAIPVVQAQDNPFQFPDTTGMRVLTATERVGDGQTFDGLGERLEIASESLPLMRVIGGTVKNLIVGAASGRGIQCQQSCILEDIYFEDVGMHNAISVVSSAPADTTVVISGGGMRNASNVGISINAGSTVTIENYFFDGFRTAIHASEASKQEDVGTVITVMDTAVRFSTDSKRFVLGKPTEGTPSSVRLQNVSVYGVGDAKVCEGPEGMCLEEDVTPVESSITTPTGAEVTLDPPAESGAPRIGGGARALLPGSGTTTPTPPPPVMEKLEEEPKEPEEPPLGAEVLFNPPTDTGGRRFGGGASATLP